SQEGSLTFSGLDNDARKIAAGLVERGLSGRNLMLLYAPGLDYIRAFFGCMYAGCVPVPAYPPMGARDIDRLKRVVQDCDAGAILSSSMLMPMIEAWVANPTNGMDMSCIATDAMLSTVDASGFQPFEANPDSVAFLQYTSGSTGHPKGVMVSHGNLLANFQQIVWTFAHSSDLDEVGPNYKTVIWLPPFHDMGLIGGVLTPVFAGAKVTLMSPLTFLKNPYVWLKTISDLGARVSGGPNFSYQYCVRKVKEEQLQDLDLSSWQVAFNGAEPIQMDSLNSFAQKFGQCGFDSKAFLPCYGLAEATLFVAGTPANRGVKVLEADLEQLAKGKVEKSAAATDTASLVSSGVLAIETDVKIVDPNAHTQCADGEVGEIWVNSPSVAQGYWDKPSFSESIFKATVKGDESGKTYMRTGDLGCIAEGELFVTGRIKELIIVAGRNHYPQDIEYSLQSSNPVFRKGCGAAFSVTEKGKEQLVVMQEVSNAAADQTDFQQLALAASRAIATRHGITPKALVFIAPGNLPKTSSGKIQRTEAKKIYELGNITPLFSWESASTQVVNKAKKEEPVTSEFTDWQSELYVEMQTWVSDKLNVEPHHIDLDVTFSELGVDSIEAIDLVDRLQDRIERTIPATELLRYPTVKALIDHFASELNDKEHQSNNEEKEDFSKHTA
ncbi:MAG: AMP-binding protein, partial [Pseudomonadales bacterium]|nr:AMP-binding protein [Pseudomonadales bacterium]